MRQRSKHITNWRLFENCIIGEYNGKAIHTSPISTWQRYVDMYMVTTVNGSIYFIYDDRK
jgi:hypothetical protein